MPRVNIRQTEKIAPEGKYSATLGHNEIGVSAKDGSQYVKCSVTTHRSLDGCDRLFLFLSLKPSAQYFTKKALDDIGVPYEEVVEEDEDGNEIVTLDFDTDDLQGKNCGIVVQHKTYNNRKQCQVAGVCPIEEAEDYDENSNENTEPPF